MPFPLLKRKLGGGGGLEVLALGDPGSAAQALAHGAGSAGR